MRQLTALLRLTALIALCAVMTACGDSPFGADTPETAVLHLRIKLANRADAATEDSSDDRERMHTLRIIILDKDGYVEHNTLHDLTADPADRETVGDDFTVKSNERKTIVLVANEESATLTRPDGVIVSASSYLRSLSAALGTQADIGELRRLTHTLADNSDPSGCLGTPLAMSAIHSLDIGPQPDLSATLLIHRAAVRYFFTFTSIDPAKTSRLTSIVIGNTARAQYFFPDADFGDVMQSTVTAYRPLPGAEVADMAFETDLSVTADRIVEAGPYYLPEGPVTSADNPYSVSFVVDGIPSGRIPLRWQAPGQTTAPELMTDLGRNTAVYVNVRLTSTSFTVNYTVCPWNDRTVDIPPFN